VSVVPDPAGVQVQRLFTNFLDEFRADNADGASFIHLTTLAVHAGATLSGT
jgi:hypothetical protein